MPIYEERLQRDLTQIRESVLKVGDKVLQAYKNSVHALLTDNNDLATQVILGDEVINNALREIDGLCHRFIAIHLPSGGHLRTISSIIRANIELERIGDYAVTISREAIRFKKPPAKKFAHDIEHIADISSQTLEMVLDAFRENNADLAVTTRKMASSVETGFERILERLIQTCQKKPEKVEDMFRLMHVFMKLIRVADQASNLSNEIMFAVTGQQRPPRNYRIWFLDENNTLSKMAEGIAWKLYPQGVEFFSFGMTPVESYDRALIEFLLAKGIDMTQERPRAFDLTPEEFQDFGEEYILVSVQGPLKHYIPRGSALTNIPFRTVVLAWDVGELPAKLNKEDTQQRYEACYREIASKVHELIQTIQGEEVI